MTKRERVISALQHKQPDYIPYTCKLTQLEQVRLDEYTGDPGFMARQGSHMEHIGFPLRAAEIAGKPGYFKDHYGVIWNRSGADKDIGVIEDPVIPDLGNLGYGFPDLDEAALRADLERLIAERGDLFVYGALDFSFFERAWVMTTMEELLAGMLLHPKQVERLLEQICEYNLRVIDIMTEYDIDGVYFGDDWGQQKGLIMGPDHWRRFIKPHLKRMYARVKARGKFVLAHSCGDIEQLFPDLIDIGLDAYNTFQPEIYDIHAVKQEFGGYLSFWGGISTQHILPMGTPDQVRAEVIEIMRVMGVGGGYIAAPTHSVPYDVTPENLLAMLDVFTNQEKYL